MAILLVRMRNQWEEGDYRKVTEQLDLSGLWGCLHVILHAKKMSEVTHGAKGRRMVVKKEWVLRRMHLSPSAKV